MVRLKLGACSKEQHSKELPTSQHFIENVKPTSATGKQIGDDESANNKRKVPPARYTVEIDPDTTNSERSKPVERNKTLRMFQYPLDVINIKLFKDTCLRYLASVILSGDATMTLVMNLPDVNPDCDVCAVINTNIPLLLVHLVGVVNVAPGVAIMIMFQVIASLTVYRGLTSNACILNKKEELEREKARDAAKAKKKELGESGKEKGKEKKEKGNGKGSTYLEARKMIEASVPAVPSDQSLANVAKPTTITKAHT
ncbi:hypothetical protein LSH36_449g01022 [Paralvinella palmiformis]|uniref:Uncharacterized protein n=1 Tax=Paralvinella palmiformis TaxID=53620 RepID=A0AAD9JBZ5_9ANNE|nr:hypothetical protein LSH36_449g01022 [Paralvinella palmiformis]